MTLTQITREKAVKRLMERVRPSRVVELPPSRAVGLAAAADLLAGVSVPEQAVSLRDGYALAARDSAQASDAVPAVLAIRGEIHAETRSSEPLEPGTAVRILTGGPLPSGADCVVAEEDVREQSGSLILTAPLRPGWFTSGPGADIGAHDLILAKGGSVTPQAAAVLARTRTPLVSVHEPPAVRILAVGSELAPPDQAGPGRIPADNLVLASGLAARTGAVVESAIPVRDDPDALMRELVREPAPALIITSGGTGRSERDFTANAAMRAGFEPLFQGVAMRPGKSVFAGMRNTTLMVSLPGPPGAVFACMHALVLPVLRGMAGFAPSSPLRVELADSLHAKPGLEWLVPCAVRLENARLTASPLIGRDVPVLLSLSRANAILPLAPGTALAPGDSAPALSSIFYS